jgi:hypothetical protein
VQSAGESALDRQADNIDYSGDGGGVPSTTTTSSTTTSSTSTTVASTTTTTAAIDDADGDDWDDAFDNCPADFNPSQDDSNFNDVGDACDFLLLTIQADGTWQQSMPVTYDSPSFSIAVPLKIVNDDDVDHQIWVDRNDDGFEAPPDFYQSVAAGTTEQISVTLADGGSYDMWCVTPGHTSELVGTIDVT